MRHLKLPFSHSYWVIPGKLLAGFYPGSESPREAEEKLEKLLETGVSCIINLMEDDEVNYLGSPFISYQPVVERLAESRGREVDCLRFPIRDFSIPSRDRMIEILGAIDHALTLGKTVYVHCLGGIGRTGTVVGCYLIRHGLARAENVLQQIVELRSKTPGLHSRSPETREQRRFVQEWGLIDGPGGTAGGR